MVPMTNNCICGQENIMNKIIENTFFGGKSRNIDISFAKLNKTITPTNAAAPPLTLSCRLHIVNGYGRGASREG